MTNNKNIIRFGKGKARGITIIVTMILAISLSLTNVSAARKMIRKSASGSFWTNNSMRYSFTAGAGLSYNGSTITSISDLVFSGTTCNSIHIGGTCSIIPRQKSKRYSGGTATYVVTLSRNAMGTYTDKVDYTFTYKTTDSGTPFSIGQDIDPDIIVTISVGEPYDIVIYDEPQSVIEYD